MTSEYVCTAEFIAKSGMIEQLILSLSKLISPTRKEAGCVRYEMYQDADKPETIFFIEKFRDKSSFEAHMNSSYVRNFIDNQLSNLVEQVTIKTYKELLID